MSFSDRYVWSICISDNYMLQYTIIVTGDEMTFPQVDSPPVHFCLHFQEPEVNGVTLVPRPRRIVESDQNGNKANYYSI